MTMLTIVAIARVSCGILKRSSMTGLPRYEELLMACQGWGDTKLAEIHGKLRVQPRRPLLSQRATRPLICSFVPHVANWDSVLVVARLCAERSQQPRCRRQPGPRGADGGEAAPLSRRELCRRRDAHRARGAQRHLARVQRELHASRRRRGLASDDQARLRWR